MSNYYSFRLRHPTDDLNELAKKIPLRLGRIWSKGQRRQDGRGVALEGFYAESYCVFKFDKKVDSIDAAVGFLANAFSNSDLLRNYVGLEKSIYCTIDGSGEVLNSECLDTLVALGIFLEID